ncbi:MAG: hypothetical protein HY832_03495 [Candidatus Aenigmarchaeota archaeon]|nr:hypothetical protein [Candidatus Aenigmarchaeota archaeon]
MKIEEVLFEETHDLPSATPYYDALEMLRRFSEFGQVIERSNDYATDGPVHKSCVYFDLVDNLDHFSHLVLSFALDGETTANHSTLTVAVSIRLIIDVSESSFFSSTFVRYYLNHVLPMVRHATNEKMHFYKDQIKETLAAHARSQHIVPPHPISH